jgi:uncharacterized protein YndB with AHSA1/START domain
MLRTILVVACAAEEITMDMIELTAAVAAPPNSVYAAWLDSQQHSEFIAGKVVIEAEVGGRFRVEWPGGSWDGHISGNLLALEPGRRIVMEWRSTAFPEGAGPSRVEIAFEPEGSDGRATRVTLVHTELPAGTGDYFRSGWENAYLRPLERFFEG